ncbi:AAA family ATPase [Deinococcus sp. HMF7604]|uniref:AAA family ATPase n=1 Tax=Deinococcus betulae TaxID=2873312 RepID=UPI001CCB79DF|nr:AAA family ATPase [Deinococcus betulae]MBZ9751448.1 AAA family ATPase [Deinococcus betulae]
MSHLFYLVGPPGAGKRTVGKALATLTGAALLDNHLTNDPVFLAAGLSGKEPVPAEVWELCHAVRKAVRAATLHAPTALAHIFTNYLSAEEQEWQNVQRLRDLAAQRGVPFVPVWLTCALPELEARMTHPARAERLKLRDPVHLRELLARAGTLPPPPDALVLDMTTMSPEDAARQIVAFRAGLT